jgi:hypothetical protein
VKRVGDAGGTGHVIYVTIWLRNVQARRRAGLERHWQIGVHVYYVRSGIALYSRGSDLTQN